MRCSQVFAFQIHNNTSRHPITMVSTRVQLLAETLLGEIITGLQGLCRRFALACPWHCLTHRKRSCWSAWSCQQS